MSRITALYSAIRAALLDIAVAFVHLTGYDIYIERRDLKVGPFKFFRDDHGPYDSQYFGLGYSVMVSRMSGSRAPTP
jgi:hypothetical protein